jgi:regulator of RNase E activity RraA
MPNQEFKADTRQRLIECGSAIITNMLLKRGLRNAYMLGLSPLIKDQRPMVGPAYTLRFIPNREDIDTVDSYASSDNVHRRAIEECPAGSVLVIDAMGSLNASSAGDNMAARLKMRGIEGIVTDGGFRDTQSMAEIALPAFQRAPAPPATNIALHPVDLDVPINCAGVAVYPGDILVGDAEGVAVIPAHLADEVAEEAFEACQYEEFVQHRISQGASLFGLFPATESSLLEYKAWKASESPDGNE